jgi:hypothetical protein
MKLIRCLPVAAMFAALFIFANLHALGIVGSSLNLVSLITVAGLCPTTLLLAL